MMLHIRSILLLMVFQATHAFVPEIQTSQRSRDLISWGVDVVVVASVADPSSTTTDQQRDPGGTTKCTWIKRSLKKVLRKPSNYNPNAIRTTTATTTTTTTAIASSPEPEYIVKDNRIIVSAPIIKPKTYSGPAEFRKKRRRKVTLPKSTNKKNKLAQKYANIDSLEERAFQILLDLGMVEIHN